MSPEVRAFVESYAQKPKPDYTVSQFYKLMKKAATLEDVVKHHNHEIWRKCPKCGHEEDLRKTFICSVCGTEIFKPKNL